MSRPPFGLDPHPAAAIENRQVANAESAHPLVRPGERLISSDGVRSRRQEVADGVSWARSPTMARN